MYGQLLLRHRFIEPFRFHSHDVDQATFAGEKPAGNPRHPCCYKAVLRLVSGPSTDLAGSAWRELSLGANAERVDRDRLHHFSHCQKVTITSYLSAPGSGSSK